MGEEIIGEEVVVDELSYLKAIAEDMNAIRLMYEKQLLQEESEKSSVASDEQLELMQEIKVNTGDILSSIEQTNTFLVISAFGVFLILGFFLAKLCWAELLGDI